MWSKSCSLSAIQTKYLKVVQSIENSIYRGSIYRGFTVLYFGYGVPYKRFTLCVYAYCSHWSASHENTICFPSASWYSPRCISKIRFFCFSVNLSTKEKLPNLGNCGRRLTLFSAKLIAWSSNGFSYICTRLSTCVPDQFLNPVSLPAFIHSESVFDNLRFVNAFRDFIVSDSIPWKGKSTGAGYVFRCSCTKSILWFQWHLKA